MDYLSKEDQEGLAAWFQKHPKLHTLIELLTTPCVIVAVLAEVCEVGERSIRSAPREPGVRE